MAKTWTLQAQERELTGKKSKRLLRQGLIPGIVYGANRMSTPIQMSARELVPVLNEAGKTHLIDLRLGSDNLKVMVKDIHFEPLTHRLRHIDLWAVNPREEVAVAVPIAITGESSAVQAGGLLAHPLDHLEVRCLPTEIPETIVVDVSRIQGFHEPIRVSDLKLPPGVQVLSDTEAVVAVVNAPKGEVEAIAEEAEAASEEQIPEALEQASSKTDGSVEGWK